MRKGEKAEISLSGGTLQWTKPGESKMTTGQEETIVDSAHGRESNQRLQKGNIKSANVAKRAISRGT